MQFHVESMTCGGCARSVTKAIELVDAQAKIETDPPTRTVKVETSATQDDILKVLDLAGYPATAK